MASLDFQITLTHQSGNLLSALGSGRPWLIERVVAQAELRLPKHQFPPGVDPRGYPAMVITNFDDAFSALVKCTRVRRS